MRSEAQKRADRKYLEKVRYTKNKPLNITISVSNYDIIDKFCKDNNISKAKFVVAACRYCIDNNIDLTDDKDK